MAQYVSPFECEPLQGTPFDFFVSSLASDPSSIVTCFIRDIDNHATFIKSYTALSYVWFIVQLGAWPHTNEDLANALTWSTNSLASDQMVFTPLGLINQGSGQYLVADHTMWPCIVFCLAINALLRDWYDSRKTVKKSYYRFYSGMFRDVVENLSELCVRRAFRDAHTSAPHRTVIDGVACDGKNGGSAATSRYLARWPDLAFGEFGSDGRTSVEINRPVLPPQRSHNTALGARHTRRCVVPELTAIRLLRASKHMVDTVFEISLIETDVTHSRWNFLRAGKANPVSKVLIDHLR